MSAQGGGEEGGGGGGRPGRGSASGRGPARRMGARWAGGPLEDGAGAGAEGCPRSLSPISCLFLTWPLAAQTPLSGADRPSQPGPVGSPAPCSTRRPRVDVGGMKVAGRRQFTSEYRGFLIPALMAGDVNGAGFGGRLA